MKLNWRTCVQLETLEAQRVEVRGKYCSRAGRGV